MTDAFNSDPAAWRVAVAAPALLGESPFWHPKEQALYYCDIAAHALHRWLPTTGQQATWIFPTDVASAAPVLDGGVLLALRDGLWRFDPATGLRTQLAAAPYDPALQRFNDGKCDPQGRFWVGTLDEQRLPRAALYRQTASGLLETVVQGVTVSNGLAWSPDGSTLYRSDTALHAVYALQLDPLNGSVTGERVFARWPVKQPGQDLATYPGRPDGAAVDAEGCYWVAMYEGQQVLRLSTKGEVIGALRLPVRCPTMPCFTGDDLKTLCVTTARQHRPAAELADQPWAGCVLAIDVDVPGLPVNFAVLPPKNEP